MRSFLFIAAMLIIMSACQNNSAEKYELRSPCTAADSNSGQATPCVRRPVNAPNAG